MIKYSLELVVFLCGGAGYSVPKDFLKAGVAVDVVEIDPELTRLSEQYFKLQPDKSPNLRIYHEDGRTFLNRTAPAQYDAIMVDAFKGYNIPFQLTTVESIIRMHTLLKADGIVLANIIASVEGEKGKFLQAQYATFKRIFPSVSVYTVNQSGEGDVHQNLMLVAAKKDYLGPLTPEIAGYLENKWTRPIPNWHILTDNYAPVD